ncbi:MAG: Uma2 family endonuclease [Lachnospiraceae bacterium]|nr:Uma2 family endonuclease [Lachnospiraceae bacterium]
MDSGAIQKRPKELIAANLKLLLQIYRKSRKEVCTDLDISYTTFCDWMHGRTYPRIDALEELSYYFRIETRDFLVDIERNDRMVECLKIYADTLGVWYKGKEEKITPEPCFTVEEYYETPEGYPLELINGRFFVMESLGARHQRIVYELGYAIGSYIKKKKGKCRVYPGPFDVELPTEKGTVAVPDITVICDNSIVNEKGCKGVPDWIIEVISVSTQTRDKREKLEVYEAVGVKEYWIVDPFEEKVCVYRRSMSEEQEMYSLPDTYSFDEEIAAGVFEDFKLRMSELDISENG